jgi:hypothetical protein
MLPRSVLFVNRTINERKSKKRGGRKDGQRRGGGESLREEHTLNTAVRSKMPSAGTSKDMKQRLPGPTSSLLSPAFAAAVCFDLALHTAFL